MERIELSPNGLEPLILPLNYTLLLNQELEIITTTALILSSFFNSLKKKTFTILSFKERTNDFLNVLTLLLKRSRKIFSCCYDAQKFSLR